MIFVFGILLIVFIITMSYIAVRVHMLEKKMYILSNVYEESLIKRYGVKKSS